MIDKRVWIEGEIQAQNFLKNNGYKILKTNFKNKIGEIDIIAYKNQTFIFVEVKARSSLKFGFPCEAVNFHKQNKIKQVAQSYLILKNKFPSSMQFDVIEILNGELNHIENAF